MKIALIGNCQIGPLGKILRLLLPDAEIPVLPAVHQITPALRDQVEVHLANADWVIGQLVDDSYHVEQVSTSALRKRFGERLIVWPNAYFSSYAPEYGVIRDPDYLNFTGPLFDYHSDKIVLAFLKGMSVEHTVRFISEPSAFDERRYGKSVENNLAELHKRETRADVAISDYIERKFISQRLFFIMNHPTVSVLIELAMRIISHVGMLVKFEPKAWMVADVEMSYVFHQENPFMRLRYEFEFPETKLSRGALLVPANNVLGYERAGPVFYTPQQLVEAFFMLYQQHRDRLMIQPRFQALFTQEEYSSLI